jgi:thiopurine S-methyltransferase
MDRTFWLERWHKREIGFHQTKVQPALEKYWPTLNLAKGATLFVPLAGKSLDMVWLRDQGYRVVGVELSEVAVAEFFAECGVAPGVRQDGAFTVSFADQIEIWRGDFFALNRSALPPLDAAYDRAALVAMPDDMQPRYAAKMAELMPAHSQTLLLGLDYNQNEMKGPPFAIPQADICRLFEADFTIDVLGVRDGLAKSDHLAKRGVTRLEEATYLLKRRA